MKISYTVVGKRREMARAAVANLYLDVSVVCSHLLLLLLLLLAFSGTTTAVSSKSLVRYLPGFDGPLPFELETGYVSIDEANDVQLFYYFVKSENNPMEDPLLVWFTGGPRCSVLTALVFQIGPLNFKKEEYDGRLPTLVLNPHSWTKASNIIFLDAPVGTGFSYSGSLQGWYTSDTKSAKQTYAFITKWLIDHPEFLSNPLYVGADSYSGLTLPIIVQHISDGIEAGYKPHLNLKGYLLGNPGTDYVVDENSRIPFAHGMGILSDEIFESAKKNCKRNYENVDPGNVLCSKDLEAFQECTSGLNIVHILEPKCVFVSPKPVRRISLEENSRSDIIRKQPARPGFECRNYGYMLSYYWANDERVQKAINIRKGTVQEWIRCMGDDMHYLKDVKSSIFYHLNLSKRHYRSLIYSGDHDMLVPFVGTRSWIRSLGYPTSDKWRPWTVDGQVAGYTVTYINNMTYATVKGAGHTAPEYMPKECLAMFKRWLSNEPL